MKKAQVTKKSAKKDSKKQPKKAVKETPKKKNGRPKKQPEEEENAIRVMSIEEYFAEEERRKELERRKKIQARALIQMVQCGQAKFCKVAGIRNKVIAKIVWTNKGT